MFGLSKFNDFGLKIVGGTFGAGKTKNIFQDCFLRKKKYPKGLLIANVPYDFVDIYFDGKDDLNTILLRLKKYIQETNIETFFKTATWLPIRVVVDEAHLYYFSRDFKKFDFDTLLILTQCRKRKVSIDFITQELAQIDVFIRRLVPYVSRYQNLGFGIKRHILYYFKNSETSDIGSETGVEIIDTEYLAPDRLMKFFNKGLQKYFNQKYLTYHVVGSSQRISLDYDGFYSLLFPLNDLELSKETNTTTQNGFTSFKIGSSSSL